MPIGRPFWIGATVLWGVATLLAVALLDRPAALLAHAWFGEGRGGFVALTHLVDPLLPLAVVGFLCGGAALLLGWTPGDRGRAAFALCTATLLAVVCKDQLKIAFGRTWPETWVANNPSLIRDGVMAFAPFHGGVGWSAFPSGHATLATAPAVVLMLVWASRWRWLALLGVGLVCLGLYGADYHYLGDILAGIGVGAAAAAITVRALAIRARAGA